MLKMMRAGFLCLVLSLFMAPAKADICDDINDLSNVWNDIANFLHEHEEDGFSEEEANQLDELVDTALDPTQTLGKALTELGNEDEAELGHQLLQYVHELRARRHGDMVSYLVDVMDDITDSLDAVTDYCDNQ